MMMRSWRDWNDAIGRSVFSERFDGQVVYLAIDGEEIERIGAELGLEPSAALESFREAVVHEVGHGWPEVPFKSLREEEYPRHLGLLAAQVVAAFGMRDDGLATENAYWRRLREFLGQPPENRMPDGLTGDVHQRLWESLEHWANKMKGGRKGLVKLSDKEGGRRHVAQPLRQCLLRRADLEKLRRLFSEYGLRGSSPMSERDLRDLVNGARFRLPNKVKTWEPLGYTTEPGASRDFHGRFDWSPQAGYPRLDPDGRKMARLKGTNLAFAFDQRPVLRVNDNAGRLFTFRQGHGTPWVVAEELKGTCFWGARVAKGTPVPVALASRRQSDILRLRPASIPSGLRLRPPRASDDNPTESSLYAGAAFYSWGHLLRLAACDLLDVEPQELDVAIRPVRQESGETAYEVVLMDTLENGAGYCRHLSQPGPLGSLLDSVTGERSDWVARIAGDEHAGRCDGSCYDCLRDYGNAGLHSVLDWRLALDLSDLADDEATRLSSDHPRWSGLVGRTEKVLREIAPNRSFRLVHPLAGEDGCGPESCNLFDAVRRPGQVVAGT